ncbi:hypothetical protein BLNAU_13529 [Blattamonas nauphoetae]|uniref:Uncharacterized protein n=1 Tax=Blattamonas nauphoetae TaxID=2049346 RepID=A0ABQ9XLK2_9EUKA|nr:hypothetical protein BLNAU_13529 [Blattamonas nauphoetae]
MFPVSLERSVALNLGQNQDEQKSGPTGLISDRELISLGESIVDGTGDSFAILHTICARFGVAPKSISIDPRHQLNPSLFIHLFSALFTYLPHTLNFHLLPLFTAILQRHPPSLPHLLSSPLWLSLPSILASSPQPPQTHSTLHTQPQPSPPNEPQREEQSHLRPVLAFVNSILQLCLSSSPPTPIPNKTRLSSSLSTLSSHPDPLVSINAGSALLCLNKLDGVAEETSIPVDELVAQREALRTQIGEKEQEITSLTDNIKQKDEVIIAKDKTINTLTIELHEAQSEMRKKEDTITSKDKTINDKDALLKQKDNRIAEMTQQMEGKDATLRKKEEALRSASETIHKKDTLLAEKNATIRQKDASISTLTQQMKERDANLRKADENLRKTNETIAKQATTIAELTNKLGEFVAMEKRLDDKLNTTHSKMVTVDEQLTEAAKDLKWLRGIARPENAITIWDPTKFRKEKRRITSLVDEWKSCFSDEITSGVSRLSVRCNKFDQHSIGVIDSSQLHQCRAMDLTNVSGSSIFRLNSGNIYQNGVRITGGNQPPNDNSVVTLELDMNSHTLVLFVDGQRQPHSLENIQQKVRFTLSIYFRDRSAEILSFDTVSGPKK